MAEEIKFIIKAGDEATAVIQQFASKTRQSFSQIETQSKSLVANLQKNWLGLTAAATAAGLAINRAWNFAEMASNFDQQQQAFSNLAASHGVNSQKIIKNLKAMSGETLSTAAVMKAAGTAMVLGIPADRLEKMMQISRASSRITGQSVQKSFEDIALGVGRQSRMILDNLGIMVNVDKANQDYAQGLGKTVTQLSDTERKQAFLNATMAAGEDIISRVGVTGMTTAEKMESFRARMEDLKITIGQGVIQVFMGLTAALEWIAAGALTAYQGFAKLMEGLNLVQSKLGLTKALREEGKRAAEDWKAIGEAAKGAAIELSGLAAKDWETAKTPFGAAGAGGGIKPPSGGGDSKDALAEGRLSFIKSLNSEILRAEQQHQDAWLALAIEYNAKEVEAKKHGKGAVLKVEEWYSAEASALLRKDGEDAAKEAETRRGKAIDELGQQNNAIASFYEKLAADTLSAQTELYGEYWALAVKFSAKEAELHAMGIDDKLALEEWYALEVERIKNKKPGSDKTGTTVTQDISSAPQAIGSVVAAFSTATAPVVAAMINLVQAIVNLPKMLTDFVKGFMQALYDFPDRLIELLDTVLSKLPLMIFDVLGKLVKMIPKILETAFKGIINMLVSIVYAMFSFIPGLKLNTGGADSGLDKNTESVNKLADSIDNLNDSINKQLTDLLTGSDSPASAVDRLQIAWAEVSKAKGLFAGATGEGKVEAGSALQDALQTYLDVAQEAYQRPSTEYQAIFDTTVADLKAIQAGLAGIDTSQSETSMYSIEFDSSVLLGIFSDAWEGLKKVFSDGWELFKALPGMMWDAIKDLPTAMWNAIKDLPQALFDAVKSAISLGGGDGGFLGIGGGGGIEHGFGLWHSGGMIRKAHDGLFLGPSLASYEVPIIAKVGEGILNDYNGMKAIGGEDGLNYANKTGKMMGGGSVTYQISPQITVNTKGEVDASSIVRQTVIAIEDSLRYGKMRQIVNA